MRKILMVLILITIHSLSESLQDNEIMLTQEERFEMLFGRTMVTLKSRPSRVKRNTRMLSIHMARMVEEKQGSISRSGMTHHRIARTSRKVCSRQRRHSLYLTLND